MSMTLFSENTEAAGPIALKRNRKKNLQTFFNETITRFHEHTRFYRNFGRKQRLPPVLRD